MRTKKGNSEHSTGNLLHVSQAASPGLTYAAAIAAALRSETRSAGHGAKALMRWSGASERAVKGWLTGRRGPNGAHLIGLMAHSDAVFVSVLRLARRTDDQRSVDLAELRRLLGRVLSLLETREASST